MTSPTRTLVLDASYEPHRFVTWQKAVKLLDKGRAEIVDIYEDVVRSVSRSVAQSLQVGKQMLAWFERCVSEDDPEIFKIRIPSVIRLLGKVGRKTSVKFSRKNVVTRDRYRCQYCGARKRIRELNYDHVVPRSAGGRTTWENIVMACYDCNSRKGSRTPDQAGMTLLSIPVRPKSLPIVDIEEDELRNVHESQAQWLYWNVELEP